MRKIEFVYRAIGKSWDRHRDCPRSNERCLTCVKYGGRIQRPITRRSDRGVASVVSPCEYFWRMYGTAEFEGLLAEASQVLYAGNRNTMESGELLPTPNQVHAGDVDLFFRGVSAGLVRPQPNGRFNTLDRPTPQGRWALLSRSKRGGWFTPNICHRSRPTWRQS